MANLLDTHSRDNDTIWVMKPLISSSNGERGDDDIKSTLDNLNALAFDFASITANGGRGADDHPGQRPG